MKNKRKVVLLVSILLFVIILALTSSYALFILNITKNTDFKITIGNLELSIIDTTTEDKFIIEPAVPTRNQTALSQDGYTFTITNTGTIDSYYTVYLDDILLSKDLDRLENDFIKFQLLNHTTNYGTINFLSSYPETNRVLTTGYLKKGESITYTLRMWVDYNAGNEAQNKYFAVQIRVVSLQQNAIDNELIVDGADQVLTDN